MSGLSVTAPMGVLATTTPPYFGVCPQYTTREQRVLWELHQSVVRALRHDPERVLRLVPHNIAVTRTHVHGPLAQRWMDEWQQAAEQGAENLVALCELPGSHGDDLRQVGPFMGVLSQPERIAAIKRAAKPAGR